MLVLGNKRQGVARESEEQAEVGGSAGGWWVVQGRGGGRIKSSTHSKPPLKTQQRQGGVRGDSAEVQSFLTISLGYMTKQSDESESYNDRFTRAECVNSRLEKE